MNKPDDGGPAFPISSVFSPEFGTMPGHNGMTLRDWFATHAPEPMLWFTPTLPPRPEDDWRVGERRCTNHNYALEWAREHGGMVTNHAYEAQLKWSNESHLIALCQWRYTYADFMLGARRSAP